MKNLKNRIDEKLSGIKMDEALADTIMDKTVYAPAKAERKTRGGAKRAIAALCCVCLLTTGTVAAANSQSIKEFFEGLNSSYSETIVNVDKSIVNDGIEVKLISALTDSRQSCVWFSVKDLTDQNRVDENIDIGNFRIFREDMVGGSSHSFDKVSFDEETKTAYYRVIGSSDLIDQANLKFSVSDIYTDFQQDNYLNSTVNLAEIVNPNPEVVQNPAAEEGVMLLKRDAMNIPIADGVNEGVITNAGIIDGDLHIQVKWQACPQRNSSMMLIENPDKLDIDVDFTVWNEPEITDKATGTPVDLNCVFAHYGDMSDPSEDENGSVYDEYVFPANDSIIGEPYDVNKLSDYTLCNQSRKYNNVISGKWATEYQMSEIETLKIDGLPDENMGIEVSPFSMYLINEPGFLAYHEHDAELRKKAEEEANGKPYSYTDDGTKYSVSVEIVLKGGETITLDETNFARATGTCASDSWAWIYSVQNTIFEKELNINNIKKIIYNGEVVYKK